MLDNLLTNLKQNRDRVLFFSQFTSLLDIIAIEKATNIVDWMKVQLMRIKPNELTITTDLDLTHIIAVTPIEEFNKRQKVCRSNSKLAILRSH